MKYIKVGISRSQYTDLYIEVPDSYDAFRWPPDEVLRRAAKETVDEGEWETDRSEASITSVDVGPVDDEEARHFKTFRWTP